MGNLRFANATTIVQVRPQEGVYVSHIIVTTQNLEQILLQEEKHHPILPLRSHTSEGKGKTRIFSSPSWWVSSIVT